MGPFLNICNTLSYFNRELIPYRRYVFGNVTSALIGQQRSVYCTGNPVKNYIGHEPMMGSCVGLCSTSSGLHFLSVYFSSDLPNPAWVFRGSEWGSLGCRLEFHDFVGSLLDFRSFVGHR